MGVTFVDHHFIPLEFEKEDKKVFFQEAAKLLEEKGLAKESFFDAIYEREKDFPTGIMLEKFGIAIPHTEGVHVNQPSVIVTHCKKPITFQSMEDPSVSIPAKLIIILALKEPEQHLVILSKLMEKFQDSTFKRQMELIQSSTEAVNMIKHIFE